MTTRFWDFVARRIEASGRFNREVTGRTSETIDPLFAADDNAPEVVFYDAAKSYLDQQFAITNNLDARSAQSFQIGSVVLTITFGLLNLNKNQTHLPNAAKWALGLALACYVVVAVFAFVVSLYRRFDYRPDFAELHAHVDELSGTGLRYWVALEYQESILENRRMLSKKAQLVGLEVLFLYLEGGALGAAALVTLFA